MSKNIFKYLFILSLLSVVFFSVLMVSAEEITLLDEDFKNVYTAHDLGASLNGNVSSKPNYVNGSQWASLWGSSGWLADKDESLMLYSRKNISYPENGSSTMIFHKLKNEEISENSKLVAYLDFKTADNALTSNTEFWWAMSFKNTIMPLRISSSVENGFGLSFASTENWPFTEKKLDRTDGGLVLQANTDYRLVITLEPNPDGTYKGSFELYDWEKKIGAGILGNYNGVNAKTFTAPDNTYFVIVSNKNTSIEEPFIYLKHMNIGVIAPEEKPRATFYPEKNGELAEINGEFFVTFNKAVNDIKIEDVTISGDAVVEEIVMSEDSKRADFKFSSLKPSTVYDVKIENVMIKGGELEFDYDWSFTTVMPVSFPNIYFDWEISKPDLNIDFTALSYGDITNDALDQGYLDGEKFYSESAITDFERLNLITENGIGYNDLASGTASVKLNRKIDIPYIDEGTVTVKIPVKIEQANPWLYYTSVFEICLKNSLDSSADIQLYRAERNRYNGYFSSLLKIGSNDYIVKDKWFTSESDLVLTLTWNSETQMYDALATLDSFTAESIACLTKEQVSGIDTLEFSINVYGSENRVDVEMIRVSGINVSCENSRTNITEGENKLLVDYVNTDSQKPFDVSFIVVTEKIDENGASIINDINIFSFTNQSEEFGTFTLPVQIIDAEGVCVKIYALSRLDDGIPLMKEVIKQ